MVSAPLLLVMFAILVSQYGCIAVQRWLAGWQGAQRPGRARRGAAWGHVDRPAERCLTTPPQPAQPPPARPEQVNYLITTSALLVRMKRKELLYRARQAARAEAAAGGAQQGGQGGGAAAAVGDAKKER